MPSDRSAGGASCAVVRVGQQVQFRENDEHPRVLGTISRVWPNGKYLTLVSDGRTFVRCIEAVTLCG